MKAQSWRCIGIMDKNPEIEKKFVEKLKIYNIENYNKEYRSDYGKDYYYDFTIR